MPGPVAASVLLLLARPKLRMECSTRFRLPRWDGGVDRGDSSTDADTRRRAFLSRTYLWGPTGGRFEWKPSAYLGEMIVMRDNGAEIRGGARRRSPAFSGEGWSTPRPAISGGGAYAVADSSFGVPGEPAGVIVIETGFDRPRTRN